MWKQLGTLLKNRSQVTQNLGVAFKRSSQKKQTARACIFGLVKMMYGFG